MALIDVLDQDVFWLSDGRRVELIDMHPKHRQNLIDMLERNCDRYYQRAQEVLVERDEPTINEPCSLSWIKSTPLYRALRVLNHVQIEQLQPDDVNLAVQLIRRVRTSLLS